MHKVLLTTGGLLLAFLVLDSASEVLAQREGGAFWGPFAHGGSHGASMFRHFDQDFRQSPAYVGTRLQAFDGGTLRLPTLVAVRRAALSWQWLSRPWRMTMEKRKLRYIPW